MKKPQVNGEVWTILKVLQWAEPWFEERDIDSPRLTAEILLAHVLGVQKIDLYLQFDKPLSPEELSLFKEYLKRRLEGEPVAYITGSRGFWTLDLEVSRDVLIPRPDTECLIEATLEVMSINDRGLKVVDLGTGSGAIVLSLASERPGNVFFGVDRSLGAISQAKRNMRLNDLDGAVQFFASSWFDAVASDARFDIIVSNPPYIPSADIESLQKEVRAFEPRSALDGDSDGLRDLRCIISEGKQFLEPGGYMVLEMGFDQRELVRGIINQVGGYEDVLFFDDLGGNNRVVRMKKKQV